MVRTMLTCVLMVVMGCTFSFAADNEVHGRVLDATGALVPGAEVTLTGANGVSYHVASDGAGKFTTPALPLGNYKLSVSAAGFAPYSKENVRLTSSQQVEMDVTLSVSADGQSVVVYGGALDGATPQPTQQEVFTSDQTLRVIDRKQMDIAGPVAGAAQIIATAPGANVTGYGNTGATKYTIDINGINQGWGGYGGITGGGSLGVTFDGVPIVDPGTGLWQSPTIPETAMVQNVNVTYGPGATADRWYTNIGGAVEFTPVQPTAKPHASIVTTYGSYFQKDMVVNATTGLLHGWSTAASVGGNAGNDFRRSPDGFKNPAKDIAVFLKTARAFEAGTFEFGGYYAHAGGYRSQVIPAAAIAGITMDAQAGSQQYSQQTSGYYSTLSYADYNKYDTNDMALVYTRQSVRLDPRLTLDNMAWFMRIDRTHYRIHDVYSPGPQLMEWNNPHTDTIGDRIGFVKSMPMNTVTGGAYFVHALYNTRNNFFNPADGGAKRTANIGGKIRSGYFNQDDFALFLQDDFRPIPKLHILPGIRYAGFRVGYSNNALQDFGVAPGGQLSQRDCGNFYSGTEGNIKDQGANCGSQQNRSGMEPSADVNYLAMPWLTIYGGYQEALKSPQLGGGGGLFQSVDPSSYHLARQRFYQGGFKIHSEGTGVLNSLLLGAAFYHQRYSNQEIDVSLANGDTIANSGTSSYHGVNLYADDDPIAHLHLFANASVERAVYTNYYTGGTIINGVLTGATSFNGLPVAYVPNSMLNVGAYYQFDVHRVPVQPMFALQRTGRQAMFDNVSAIPSNQTMPAFTTANMGVKAPMGHVDVGVNALNIFRNRYNEYEYISSGGYFGTPTGGYVLAYPGSPASVYGTVTAHF